jgi:hypothetical protein
MAKKNFFNVPQKPVKTSIGSIDFPMLYSEAEGVLASFWVDYDKALDKLSDTGLRPAMKPLSFTKKAVLSIGFFEYRECSAGSYNEVAVGIYAYPESIGSSIKLSLIDLLKKPENRTVGIYMLDLPVTTDWATAGGVELYGYPKWVADIPLNFSKENFEGHVIDPDTNEKVLSLSGTFKGIGVKTPVVDFMSYSILNKQMLKTSIFADGFLKSYMGRGFTLKAGSSSHGSSSIIKDFGLDGAVPFSVSRTINIRSKLELGIPC